MLWEIANPSDAYTMEAESFEVAVAACLFLGQGRLALRGLTPGAQDMPLFLFGGHDMWIRATFGKDLAHVLDSDPVKVADALSSVLLAGDAEGRRAYEGLSEEQRMALHDQRRSSMNDIGRAAWAMAAAIRAKARSGGAA